MKKLKNFIKMWKIAWGLAENVRILKWNSGVTEIHYMMRMRGTKNDFLGRRIA